MKEKFLLNLVEINGSLRELDLHGMSFVVLSTFFNPKAMLYTDIIDATKNHGTVNHKTKGVSGRRNRNEEAYIFHENNIFFHKN